MSILNRREKVLGLDIKDARKFFTTITAASGQDELDIDILLDLDYDT